MSEISIELMQGGGKRWRSRGNETGHELDRVPYIVPSTLGMFGKLLK